MGLKAEWHAEMHTDGWTVERAGWLISKHMDKQVERREGSPAGQQTSNHEQVNNLARPLGRWGSKLEQTDERITVDGITGDGLSSIQRDSLREWLGSRIRSGWGSIRGFC